MNPTFPMQSAVVSAVAGIMEGSGIPFPGGVLLTATGASFPTLIAAVVLATLFSLAYLLSSSIQYYLGLSFGPILERLLPSGIKRRLEQVMHRHGEAAVLWTRPLALGNYISIPAGMMRMPMGKFLLYTFLGIWPWAFVMTSAGSYLGAILAPPPRWVWYVGGCVVATMVLLGFFKLWRRIRHASATFGD